MKYSTYDYSNESEAGSGIFCTCGEKLAPDMDKCPKCHKELDVNIIKGEGEDEKNPTFNNPIFYLALAVLCFFILNNGWKFVIIFLIFLIAKIRCKYNKKINSILNILLTLQLIGIVIGIIGLIILFIGLSYI